MPKDGKHTEGTRVGSSAGQRSSSTQAPSGGEKDAKTSSLLPTLSPPKGGGAIRGIGEKFSANPVTGTGSLSIPIATSPGRAGFELGLALNYDSGAGNGPFGIGWNLSTPSITRKTDKGLPRYEDAADSDTFILSGAEDLVPVCLGDGAQTRLDIVERGDYRVQRYRPRTEGLFARIERWTHRTVGAVHWRVTTRDNVLNIYGRNPAARIADPEHPERVFSWLLEETRDDRGNLVRYTYKPEDAAGVATGRTSESNRFEARADGSRVFRASAQRYLKRIQYGNGEPVLDREAPAPSGSGDYLFEVVFDYGEHDDATPTPAEVKPWAVRRDSFSSYRATFEVRTYRLCRRVLMFHRFAELGPTPCLVRSTDFIYDEGPAITYLQTATQAGYKRNGENGTYLRATLPPLELGYVRPVLHDELRTINHDSLEGIRGGVEGTGAQWVDLDGEGIPGVLIPTERAWFYKANLGGGHLAPPALLRSLPSPAELGSGVQQLTDIDGNGRLELVQYAPPLSGYFERTSEGGWEPFMALPSLPTIDWNDPNLRFIDLDGDGFPDVLITEDHSFVWYRSRARKGFEPAVILSKDKDELKGPTVIFADGSETIHLADMSGDGLVDITRVRNGEVCYWPNLGYGQFGRKVTLELSAPFDAPDQFDPKRIRFADIDGSGTSDIIYRSRDCVRLYFNQAGNELAAPAKLESLPPIDSLSGLSVVDLLGQGTACLVWSSPVPANQTRPLAYIDLLGGKKPHVLEKVVNNLGAETRVQYAPSTRFYLADKAAGKPWITRLPFPVHVIERIEIYDHISRNRFVTRYAYHHGYFDGVEREFRGFGMVEQWDTEELGALSTDGTLPAASNINAASHVPPVLARTWFHTGAFLEGRRIARQFEAEYYREPGLSDAQFEAQLLPDTTLDPSWSFEEMREACRALRGSLLRQEIYALDGSESSAHPYSVSERSYALIRLQQRVGEHQAALFVHPREAINYHYERESADPRIQHELTLEVDSFGNALKTAAIGYGRRRPDPELPTRDQVEQARAFITYSENDFTLAVDEDSSYRAPQPCERLGYELTGLPLPAGHDRVALEHILGAGQTAARIDYEQAPTPGLVQKRLIECVRTLYRRDDLGGPLALGKLESRALPYESYKLAFTPGLIALVYGDRVADSMLEHDGHYVRCEADDGWWIPSGRIFYSSNLDHTTGQELNEAREHFFLPRRLADPFGYSTIVTYDPYDLLVQETQDPLGNCVTAGARDAAGHLIENGNDYRVLQPRMVMDPNRNLAAVAFDAQGMVVGTAIMGKPEENLGDSLAGFEPDLSAEVIASHVGDPQADPHLILQRATTRLVYDFFAYQRSQGTLEPQPSLVYTLTRENHNADLLPGQSTKIQHSFSYSDGFGREIQKKIQAEPGPLVQGGLEHSPRWVGTGWTIFNNKGNPVRQYEPFFTDTHHFEFNVRIGISPVLFYDPMERVVGTLHPNHTWEKVVFEPWRQATWNVNDTVLVVDPGADRDVGDYFVRLPSTEYLPTWYATRQGGAFGPAEQAAARKAEMHAATPTVAHADSLGRTIITVAHNRFKHSNASAAASPTEEFYETRVIFDIEGNQRQVIDANGRVAVRYGYDMLGNRIHQASMDAGERWMLNDVAGKTIYAWNSRGHQFRSAYDALQRPTESFVRKEGGRELLVGRSVYGESRPNPEAKNLRGKLIELYDQAGIVTSESYDFKGNLLASSRQLVQEYKDTVDWSAAVPRDAETYTSRTRYDALNRPTQLVAPHSDQASSKINVIQPSYNEGNLLERMEVWLDHGALPAGLLNPASTPPSPVGVDDIDYDAKGQRLRIDYKNGVSTRYNYDPETFRLTRLYTRRGATFTEDCENPQSPPPTTAAPDSPPSSASCGLQNLYYTYDPAGNITHIRDDAQQAVYFRNTRVDPSGEYTYDAIFRLIEATGREHLGQVGQPPLPHSYNDAHRVGLPHTNDANAMGRYLERYLYDAVGNILSMQHRGMAPPNPGWIRIYSYSEPSLLEPAKHSNRLSCTTVGTMTAMYSTVGDGYDAHGNMLRMPQLQVMQWNERDQLQMTRRQATHPADDEGVPRQGERTWYVYDAAGQRVRKVTELANGQIKDERIYLGGFEIYRKRDGNHALVRETLHIMDDKQRIALIETRIQGNEPGIPAQLIRYQVGNHSGSASLELDDQARVISYEEYTPFGSTSYQAVRSQTETPKRYRYSGKERDAETGLSYYGGRYGMTWVGRWTSFDPALLIDRNAQLRSVPEERRLDDGPEEPGSAEESGSPENPRPGEANLRRQSGAMDLNGYCHALNNPMVYQDPDGWAPVPIGHVYVVRGTLGGKAVTYSGSTAQELLKRVGSRHKWNALITAKSTTVTTYEVHAELNVAASGRGTFLSARTEALRAAEQRILSQVQKENAIVLNEIRAAAPENAQAWAQRHAVKVGSPKLTLKGGVKVGAFAGFALLDIFNMYREEKMSRYVYAPYVLEDEGGQFTLSEERAHWFAHHYRWKVYQSGTKAGQKVEIDEAEFDFWKKEGELLWGTTNFWGDFVPGLLRPHLPVMDVMDPGMA